MDTFFDRLIWLIGQEAEGKPFRFAKLAKIKTGTFQSYKAGRVPKVDQLLSICETFNVDLNWLLRGIGEPYLEGKPSRVALAKDALPFQDEAVNVNDDLTERVRASLKSSGPQAEALRAVIENCLKLIETAGQSLKP